MTDTAAKPASKPTAGQTTYVVLRRDTPAGAWIDTGPRHTTRTTKQAIEQAVELRAEAGVATDGEYVAVPARSWRPVTVTVETKTTIRLG